MEDEIECVTKQWGGSIGIVIPKEIVVREHIHPNEKVRVTVTKMALAKSIWLLGPVRDTQSTQEIKDELKKGW